MTREERETSAAMRQSLAAASRQLIMMASARDPAADIVKHADWIARQAKRLQAYEDQTTAT